MARGKSSPVEGSQHITWSYREGHKTKDIPWGPHKLPVALDLADVSIVTEKNAHGFLYRRDGAGEKVEKSVLADKGNLYFYPIEPLHKPANVSVHLLIEFDQPVVIEPRAGKVIKVTFPLELACMVDRRRVGEHVLDIFTLCPPKFTLYGNVKDGLVCKYWKSAVYNDDPAANPLEQGIMKVEIKNSLGRWAEVRRAVFSAYGMKLYYGPKMVSLNATMKINSELTAETSFNDQPLQPGMRKALEQFSSRLLSLPGRMVMEEGY
jgi:uncharacterized protein